MKYYPPLEIFPPPYDPRLDEQFFAHFQSIFTIFFVHTIYPWEFPYRDFQKLAIFYHQWHAGKSQFVDFLYFFWIILTQNSCFFTSFCYMWNTIEKVFISKMKNVWFWLENELKWDQWCRNYSYFFFLFSKKMEPRPSSKCEDLQQDLLYRKQFLKTLWSEVRKGEFWFLGKIITHLAK